MKTRKIPAQIVKVEDFN